MCPDTSSKPYAELVRVMVRATFSVECWTCTTEGLLVDLFDSYDEAMMARADHIEQRHSDQHAATDAPKRNAAVSSDPLADTVRARYHMDPIFHAVTHLLSDGGYADENGVAHDGPTLADAQRAARLIDGLAANGLQISALNDGSSGGTDE